MPRRLSRPRLADDLIGLEPLGSQHVPELTPLVADEDVRRFTMVPSRPAPGFPASWIARYEAGWDDESRAGFAIRLADGRFGGFAAIVRLDLDGAEGEIGYAIDAAARGQGVATRSVRLLTGWGFDELALERLELRIDVENRASAIVAGRAGYRLDGVLRSVSFKEGLRTDLGIWSRLRAD